LLLENAVNQYQREMLRYCDVCNEQADLLLAWIQRHQKTLSPQRKMEMIQNIAKLYLRL
jgi:hypothetical protein